MTDEQWHLCGRFEYMLVHLGVHGPRLLPADGERRLRLLACAACRRIWHLLDDPCREAVGVAERHADGLARPGHLRAAKDRLDQRLRASGPHHDAKSGVMAASQACQTPPGGRWALDAAGRAVAFAHGEDTMPRVPEASPHYLAECLAQADLIRDLYGDPPGRRVSIPLA